MAIVHHFRDLLPQVGTITLVFTTLAIILITYTIGNIIYNLYLHPLADIPGPKLWAISRIPYNWHTLRGTSAVSFLKLHQRYGQTVRYSPNGVVYSTPESWEEVYGPYKGERKHMEMDPAIFGGGLTFTGAITITNAINAEHQRLRMRFMRALSAKAVAAQEPLLLDYAQKLVTGINRELASPGHDDMVDIARWLSMATFDLVGDLAFSKSFGCLETGILHPWIGVVFGAFKALPCLRVIREIPGVPFFGLYALYLLPKSIKQMWQDHFNYAADLIDKRMASGEDRPDMAHYLTTNEGLPLTLDEIKENAVQMVTAGSEPPSTFSAGLLYLLAQNPGVYARLKTEIKTAFSQQSDITLSKLSQLDYLQRVIREGLRLFPPAADIFPRVIPEGGDIIAGRWMPAGSHVSICAYAISRDERNFPNPQVFDPERWLPEKVAADPRLKASQPFGLGHRACLGKILATAEVRLLVSTLILNYDFELLPKDHDWLQKCKVFIGWEKIPLMFKTKPLTPLFKEVARAPFGDFIAEKVAVK